MADAVENRLKLPARIDDGLINSSSVRMSVLPLPLPFSVLASLISRGIGWEGGGGGGACDFLLGRSDCRKFVTFVAVWPWPWLLSAAAADGFVSVVLEDATTGKVARAPQASATALAFAPASADDVFWPWLNRLEVRLAILIRFDITPF